MGGWETYQVDVFSSGLEIVVASKDGVSGGKNGGLGVQDGGDAGLFFFGGGGWVGGWAIGR